jgi:hypothetical protein
LNQKTKLATNIREKEKIARRETELMDEIAGQQHYRKQDD